MDTPLIMEHHHTYRIDSARHLIAALTLGQFERLCSFEAALIFIGKEQFAVTINCALR